MLRIRLINQRFPRKRYGYRERFFGKKGYLWNIIESDRNQDNYIYTAI